MSQEEKGEPGRAEGGGKSKPKHAPVSSKQSPSPGHVPSVGRMVCSPGRMEIHQLIKFTAWHSWQTSTQKSRGDKDSPSYGWVPFTWWEKSWWLETLGGSSSTFLLQPLRGGWILELSLLTPQICQALDWFSLFPTGLRLTGLQSAAIKVAGFNQWQKDEILQMWILCSSFCTL